jgi:FAD/FMN-containing dehydrogenase
VTADLMSSLPSELTDVTHARGDDVYSAAATVYVRTGSPALVVRPETPEQVAAAIQHAVAQRLPLSIRGGGHSVQAWGTNDDGLVVDMSAFAAVEVLGDERVRVGAGARWGDVATTLGAHGLALTSGDTRSVGVGGLTTGGGIGWMVRNHGLTIDSLVSADIVTVDGRVLHLTETENADLFWAIRGGGGNFGVLTGFEFVPQRVTTVHAGMIMYAPDDVPGVLRGWVDAHREGPEELNSTLVFFPELGDPMPPAGLMGLVCYAGADEAAAAAAFAPLLSLGTVRMSQIDEKPYADVLEEAHPPPGVRAMASNTLVERVDDRVVDAVDRFYAGGTTGRMMFVRALGGAMNRVAADATAVAHRNVEALVLGGLFASEETSDAEMLERLQPFEEFHGLGVGSYPGFVATNLPGDVERIYPPATLARLREVKRTHDPDNVFRNNFNIAP